MTLRTHRPNRTGPAGFTLIELLVVIAVIAVLMGLLMAAVQKVRETGPRTENYTRMAMIGDAIGVAKSKNNMPYVWSGRFNLKVAYQQSDPELDILLAMFPNMDWGSAASNNGLDPALVGTLDANQALALLLTGGAATNYSGFSTNPKKPFSPVTVTGEQRKGPYLEPNMKIFSVNPPGLTANGHAWLVDPFGTPYAVFAATKGKIGNYGVNANPVLDPGAQTLYSVTPYKSGGKYVNESGYQIISAGKDKMFGTGDTLLPAMGTPGGNDDQANFSRSILGSGIN